MAAQPLQPVATRAAAQSSPRHPRAMTVAVAGARKAVVAAAGSSLSSPRRPMGPVNNGLRRSPRLGRPADTLSPAHKAAVTALQGKEVRWHIYYMAVDRIRHTNHVGEAVRWFVYTEPGRKTAAW